MFRCKRLLLLILILILPFCTQSSDFSPIKIDPFTEEECNSFQKCDAVSSDQCSEETECIYIGGLCSGIKSPLCVDQQIACKKFCGSLDKCMLFQSFPPQLGCIF